LIKGDEMQVNGTLMNYYFHCKRQCYLHGNRLNLEDNSEIVKVGRAIHEEKDVGKNTEIEIDNIKIDKISKEYVTEVKKSDADIEAARWQILYYLKVLKTKGIIRKGRLEVVEKNKSDKSTFIIELGEQEEKELDGYILDIENLINSEDIPETIHSNTCKKCAYYEYCYI
jgi:CRISPR-associated exonuclease Cas4